MCNKALSRDKRVVTDAKWIESRVWMTFATSHTQTHSDTHTCYTIYQKENWHPFSRLDVPPCMSLHTFYDSTSSSQFNSFILFLLPSIDKNDDKMCLYLMFFGFSPVYRCAPVMSIKACVCVKWKIRHKTTRNIVHTHGTVKYYKIS